MVKISARSAVGDLPIPEPRAPLPGLTVLEAVELGVQLDASETAVAPGIFLLSYQGRRICFGRLGEEFRLAIDSSDIHEYKITLSPADYMELRDLLPL